MSKVFTQSGFRATREANKITSLSDSKSETFNRLWLWPASAVTSGGKLTANAGDVYVGERTDSGDVTPDKLGTDDLSFLIQLPEGQTKLLRDVIVQADNSGDGVFFKYW